MIHAYFTDGMYPLAEVFLRSLYKTSGCDNFRVFLSTRNLTGNQVSWLKEFYPGQIVVENQNFDMEVMAARANCTLDEIVKYKDQCEKGFVTQENKVWKLMIAADDRPRSLYKLMQRGYGAAEPILHFDIDTLFRRNISPLLSQANKHDCGLLLRGNHPTVKARITISTMTWKRNERTLKFFKRWMHYLDILPPDVRPIGYGQSSCWYAFTECRHDLKYFRLSERWGYPGKKSNKDSNYIWSGAVHKLRKDDCAKQFGKEMEILKCG